MCRNFLFVSIYIKQTACTYLAPISNANCRTMQSLPNFAQTSTPIQGRFLAQVWPCQPIPLTLGNPSSKSKQVTVEKTLLYKKCILDYPDWIIFLLLRLGQIRSATSGSRKFPPKIPIFSEGQKNLTGSKQISVSPLFTAGQKYACVGLGQAESISIWMLHKPI